MPTDPEFSYALNNHGGVWILTQFADGVQLKLYNSAQGPGSEVFLAGARITQAQSRVVAASHTAHRRNP
jgi:hypothetical protein